MSGWMTILRGAAATGSALVLGACLVACETPLERAWGVSQGQHVAQSIANPKAGLDNQETPRPDGQSTDSAFYKFRTNEAALRTEQPPPIISILGGTGAGGH